MVDAYDFLFKSIIVGDGGCGKTAIVVRFSQGFFKENYKMTIGVEFAVKNLEVVNSKDHNYKVKLQIWDTGGQDRFQYVRPLYYKGAMGVIVLFDLTNRESYDHIPRWIDEVYKEVGKIPTLLVGNKSDLTDLRQVSQEEGQKFADKLGYLYAESSAKSGVGVGDIFEILALMMIGEEVPVHMLQTNLHRVTEDASLESANLEDIASQILEMELNQAKAKTNLAPLPPPSPMGQKPTSLSLKDGESALKPKVSAFVPRSTQIRPSPLSSASSQDESAPIPPVPPKKSEEPKEFSPLPSKNPFLSHSGAESLVKSTEKDQNADFAPNVPARPVKTSPTFSPQETNKNPFMPRSSSTTVPFAKNSTLKPVQKPSDASFLSGTSSSQSEPSIASSRPSNLPFTHSSESSKPRSNPFISRSATEDTQPKKTNIPFFGDKKEKKPEEKPLFEKKEIIERNLKMNTASRTFTSTSNPFLTPKTSHPFEAPEPPKLSSEPTPTPRTNFLVCSKCGKQVPKAYKYCNKCGTLMRK